MRNYKGYEPTQITREPNELGTSIEEMIRSNVANKQPIEGNSALIYTDRKDGVLPQYDPRTDRFDLALEATNKHSKSVRARAQEGAEDPFKEPVKETPKNE